MPLQVHFTGSCLSTALCWESRLPFSYSLANQEVLRWQMAMQKEIGDTITHDNIKESLWKTLKAGRVVPGWVQLVMLIGMISHFLQLWSRCPEEP